MEMVTRDEAMEAATEFGEALRATEECRAVDEALEALSVDEEANRAMAGEPGPSDSNTNMSPVILRHLEAQRNLQALLERLNAEISGILGFDFVALSRQKKCGCH